MIFGGNMLRKAWILTFILLLISVQVMARPFNKFSDSKEYQAKALPLDETTKIIHPDDEVNAQRSSDLPYRDPARDPAYGDEMVIGYTWYDYQHNGSIGNMIETDSEGGVHFIWMWGYNAQQDPRHVCYNYLSPNGDLLNDPEQRGLVDNGGRAGYTCLDVLPIDGKAVGFYHVLGHLENDPQYVGTGVSTDWVPGAGAFQPSYPQSWPEVNLIWPHGAADRQNHVHVLATEYGPDDQLWQRVGYWRGAPDQDYLNWEFNNDDVAVYVDTSGVISAIAAASLQSNKVALTWHWNRVGATLQRPNGNWDESRGGWQRNNDIRYIISEDGENWDWEEGVESMTKVRPPIPDLAEIDMMAAYGDLYRPYCDVDIEFDPWEGEDNLYGVFAASGFHEEPVADDDPEPVDIVYAVMGHLWFWNSVEDTITCVYDGWYNQYMDNPNTDARFRCGAWRLNADRGQIAFNPEDPGTIYVVWVRFPYVQEDFVEDGEIGLEFFEGAQDTSESGYLNGDVMVSVSTDRGITWREPVNVTETIWDQNGEEDRAPEPGECMSETHISAATIADGTLHIFYIRDTDAGGIPQEEGAATNSPVMYHWVNLEDLPLNDPIDIPDTLMWHNYFNPRPNIENVERLQGVPTPGMEVTVTANVSAMGDREITGAWLQYALNPDEEADQIEVQEIEMENIEGELYSAAIPGQNEGAWVWYRVRAMDSEDQESVTPDGYWGSYVVRPEGGLTIRDVQYRPRAWNTDYSPYKDFEVTVTGVVTTPASFAGQMGGFAIQDGAEAWSGVYVRGANPGLEVGALVRVTGLVMERDPDEPQKWRWMTHISVESEDNIEVLGNEEVPEPIEVTIEDISSMQFMAEDLEGCLVRTGRFEVYNMANAEGLTYIPITSLPEEEDRPMAYMTTYGLDLENAEIEELDIDQFREGTTFAWMVGVLSENDHYAIAPRDQDDFGPFGVDKEDIPVPQEVTLHPAYPNPFNATTRIAFNLRQTGYINLSVYDLSGRLVATLVEGQVDAGNYYTTFEANDLTNGVYVLRLDTETKSASQKLVLVK